MQNIFYLGFPISTTMAILDPARWLSSSRRYWTIASELCTKGWLAFAANSRNHGAYSIVSSISVSPVQPWWCSPDLGVCLQFNVRKRPLQVNVLMLTKGGCFFAPPSSHSCSHECDGDCQGSYPINKRALCIASKLSSQRPTEGCTKLTFVQSCSIQQKVSKWCYKNALNYHPGGIGADFEKTKQTVHCLVERSGVTGNTWRKQKASQMERLELSLLQAIYWLKMDFILWLLDLTTLPNCLILAIVSLWTGVQSAIARMELNVQLARGCQRQTQGDGRNNTRILFFAVARYQRG